MPRNGKRNPGRRGRRGNSGRGQAAEAGTLSRVSPGAARNAPGMRLAMDRPLGLVAQSIRVPMSWSKDLLVTSSLGNYAETAFFVNSAFNGGSGAQYAGYTKYMAFYSKAYVLSATVQVSATNIAVGAGNSTVVGSTMSTLSTAFASAASAIEAGYCHWAQIGIYPDTKVWKTSVNVGEYLNKPRVLDDPQLYSNSSADAQQLIWLHLWIDPNVAGYSPSVTFIVQLVADVVFTDPIPFT